ncbi:MAG: ATP-binding protein [Peptococcaceae bacterium]|jgi:predicted ATPase|nr:ATP-binding protein [Peptococcaceae bacterium]
MITLIESLNFRCLKYVRQDLGPFHVLVGPNASGKTTFLDVIGFLGDMVSNGLEFAINERNQNFTDLVSGRSGEHFELAIEAGIPDARRHLPGRQPYNTIRYEIKIGIDHSEISILAERALLKSKVKAKYEQKPLFPASITPPDTILTPKGRQHGRTVINKVYGGNDNYYSEVYTESGKGWAPAFKLGSRKSALCNLPEDESKFPVTTWLKDLLTQGVQKFVLNSMLIRRASPPGQVRGFKTDGSNLPWVISALHDKSPQDFGDWISHLRTALPDLSTIKTVTRPDDMHRYLVICYQGGLEVPSWLVSDGTLWLLALTIPAYLREFKGVYLIEEPENGIHPRAVERVYQSLSSVYNAQILMATQSPVILSLADAEKILCFAKTPDNYTDIILGSEHPALMDWNGETNLGVLFAGGILG